MVGMICARRRAQDFSKGTPLFFTEPFGGAGEGWIPGADLDQYPMTGTGRNESLVRIGAIVALANHLNALFFKFLDLLFGVGHVECQMMKSFTMLVQKRVQE